MIYDDLESELHRPISVERKKSWNFSPVDQNFPLGRRIKFYTDLDSVEIFTFFNNDSRLLLLLK